MTTRDNKRPLFTAMSAQPNMREEDDGPDDSEGCRHENSSGSKYRSKYCPDCGKRL